MTTRGLLTRRMAIAEMGKAGLAVVVFGTAACSDPSGSDSTTTALGAIQSTTAPPESSGDA
ncbi:MAG TPA: hypothetical protein VK990_03460, partial [Acidimicrobiia bacterium]|nr:hypothetical protein [Acidimicrobiia bacterium]